METDREFKCKMSPTWIWTFGPQLVILSGKLWTPLDVGLSCLPGKGDIWQG